MQQICLIILKPIFMKMFNRFKLTLCALVVSSTFTAQAQAQSGKKPLLGITYIDVQNVEFPQSEITSILRIETDKLQKFEVSDRYEIDNYYKTHNIDAKNCMSKTCIIQAGKDLKLDFVVSGSVEKIGQMLAINLREYNVQNETMVNSVVKEFIYQPGDIQTLMRFSVKALFGDTTKSDLEKLYSYEKHEDDLVNKPDIRKLNLSGPRFGVSMLTGMNSNIFKNAKSDGGFDGMPFLTQFGYHTEARYMNTGNVMALVEFVGLVGGMEQQLFIPSLAVVNGFRHKKSRLEFGFGPMFTIQRKADGYYDANNTWHLQKSLSSGENANIVQRIDSRGAAVLTSNWVFAVGKTFTSGNLNVPVNVYAIPNRDGWQFGISMGWSVEKK